MRKTRQHNLLTFQKCNEMFKKARYCKYIDRQGVRLENNTYLLQHADCYSVQYHQTDIIDIYPNKWVIRNGGWQTISTKDKTNRYSPISISSNRGCWYYTIGNDWQNMKEFVNNLVITKEDVVEQLI